MPHHAFNVGEDIRSRNPADIHPLRSQPLIPERIPDRPVSATMSLAVDFDGEAKLGTEEVQNLAPCGMLPPELQSGWPFAELAPQQHFGQAHVTA